VLIQGNAAQDNIRAVAVLAAFSEYGEHTADILHLPSGIVADAAGPLVFPCTEAEQPGLRMLAVYRHRLAFADNLHRCFSLKPASFGKRHYIHPADHQMVQQANINQLQRLFQAFCN
jgi:hypothetical protein